MCWSQKTSQHQELQMKMICQTLVYLLKKLFDMGLLGLTAVVFGCRGFRAAGQKKPPVAAMQEVFGWQDDMATPGHKHIAVSEERVRKDGKSSR